MGFGDVFSKLFKKENEETTDEKDTKKGTSVAEGQKETPLTSESGGFPEFSDEESLPAFFTGELYTETMGDIYMSQGLHKEAMGIFEKLLKQDPENESIRKKLDQVKTFLLSKRAGRSLE